MMETMSARIFKPTKTAMQSGKAKTDAWVLEFEQEEPRKVEPLMGYTSSSDTRTQIKLEFKSLDDAKAYAEKNGIAYSVQKPQKQKRRIMSYAENFSTDRTLPWTH
jgi:hypothetical protein